MADDVKKGGDQEAPVRKHRSTRPDKSAGGEIPNVDSSPTGKSAEAVGSALRDGIDSKKTDTGGDKPKTDAKVGVKDLVKAGKGAATGDYSGAIDVLKKSKNAEKAKKEAKKNGEEVDGGIDLKEAHKKATRFAIGTTAAGKGAGVGLGLFLLNKMLLGIKAAMAMAMSAATTVAGALVGGITAIGTAIAGAFSVSTLIGNVIGGVLVAATVTGTVAVGGVVVQTATLKDDSMLCIPSQTKVSEASQEYVAGGGEFEKIREGYAIKLWSVFEALGSSKQQAAAVLGNFHVESLSLDPTCVEGFYGDEHKYILSEAERQEVAANTDGGVGIGLAQWTWGRNQGLQAYATTKGSNWYDFDTQVMYLLEGDNPSDIEMFKEFMKRTGSNIDIETEWFLMNWERAGVLHLENRQNQARNYLLFLEKATSDTNYANSILSKLNLDSASGNAATGAFHQDDGCGESILSHYSNKSADGTGVVPSDVDVNQLWTPATLPESLKAFYSNPEDLGLVYGSDTGWQPAGPYGGQCVAFSHAMFMKMYDTPLSWPPLGNGQDIAQAWADAYGQSVTNEPSAGAVFSSYTSTYGHTGIVQHVFANGDMLVCEQNMYGYSGDNNGTPRTWSWRIVLKSEREGVKWEYFKPAGIEPRWKLGS